MVYWLVIKSNEQFEFFRKFRILRPITSVRRGPGFAPAGPFAPAKFWTPAPAGPSPRQNYSDPAPGGAATPAKYFDPAPGGAAAPATNSLPRPRRGCGPGQTFWPRPRRGRRPGRPGLCFLGVEAFLCLFFVFFTGLFTLTFKGTFNFFLGRKFSSRALSWIFRRVKKTVSWLNFLEFF